MYPRLGVNERPLKGGVSFGLSKDPWWSVVHQIFTHNLVHLGSKIVLVEVVVEDFWCPMCKTAYRHVPDKSLVYLGQKMG